MNVKARHSTLGSLLRSLRSRNGWTLRRKRMIPILTRIRAKSEAEFGELVHHSYVTADGCEEAVVLGVCSSTEESLMESLMSLHGDTHAATSPPASSRAADRARLAARPVKARKRRGS